MRLNAKQIAEYTGGTFIVNPLDPRTLITGLTWDSRDVAEGDCYVALPGERVDGHQFVPQALSAGAACVLVTLPIDETTRLLASEMGAAVIEVADGAAAITDLATMWRKHLRGRIIGVTGSVGKTTVKNLVRDVLASGLSVVATKGNQNNELGVPATILRANPETQAVVVEMGMRGLGQITDLAKIVRPDWGVISVIGVAHMELLGSQDNIVRAKAELFEALPNGTGRAFRNAGDPLQDTACEYACLTQRDITCVAYGAKPADGEGAGAPCVWAEDVSLDPQGCPQFTLCARGFAGDGAQETSPCHMTLRGEHNVANACAAAAVGLSMGISLEQAAHALEGSVPEQGRQEIRKSRAGVTLVNDAYNANPESMRASLTMMCSMDVRGRRVAVLGDMAELGDSADACHRGVGAFAAGLSIDRLICVGELARLIGQGAADAGMSQERIVYAANVAEVLGYLDDYLEEGDCVLAKASNVMGLGRVIEGLMS